MNKGNKVKHLNKKVGHRQAMLGNLVQSLLYHENITTTVAKAKVTRQIAEKLITRARENQNSALSAAEKVHNLREAAKIVKDKEILHKLFDDIAPRFVSRPGGYTRILRVGQRVSDASEMAIIQLVERKELAQLKDDRKAVRAARLPKKKRAVSATKSDKSAKEKKATKK
ncbi:MAG TPA: 50S ribosomal protein L17 [Turneriella sp.]|nr:50S ribosomal protein L17 [Turneriella sp.]